MMRCTSFTALRYSPRWSMRIAEKSSVSRSRSSLATRLSSRWTIAGARRASLFWSVSDHSSWK